MRYLVNFSYDGSRFNGYQKQKNLRTIQGEIETALESINNKKTKFTSSGRTDASVHANNQYGHVDIDVDITEYKLKSALNTLLPDDIYVKDVKEVKSDFHARYMVYKKEYVYKLNIGDFNPIERDYVYQYCKILDIKSMKKAIKYFEGTHDFTSFSSNQDRKEDNVRTIYNASLKKEGDYLIFTFTGTGFLKYMVRIMVGALLMVGTGKINYKNIKDIFNKKDKSLIKITAPGCGLYLNNVWYKKI